MNDSAGSVTCLWPALTAAESGHAAGQALPSECSPGDRGAGHCAAPWSHWSGSRWHPKSPRPPRPPDRSDPPSAHACVEHSWPLAALTQSLLAKSASPSPTLGVPPTAWGSAQTPHGCPCDCRGICGGTTGSTSDRRSPPAGMSDQLWTGQTWLSVFAAGQSSSDWAGLTAWRIPSCWSQRPCDRQECWMTLLGQRTDVLGDTAGQLASSWGFLATTQTLTDGSRLTFGHAVEQLTVGSMLDWLTWDPLKVILDLSETCSTVTDSSLISLTHVNTLSGAFSGSRAFWSGGRHAVKSLKSSKKSFFPDRVKGRVQFSCRKNTVLCSVSMMAPRLRHTLLEIRNGVLEGTIAILIQKRSTGTIKAFSQGTVLLLPKRKDICTACSKTLDRTSSGKVCRNSETWCWPMTVCDAPKSRIPTDCDVANNVSSTWTEFWTLGGDLSFTVSQSDLYWAICGTTDDRKVIWLFGEGVAAELSFGDGIFLHANELSDCWNSCSKRLVTLSYIFTDRAETCLLWLFLWEYDQQTQHVSVGPFNCIRDMESWTSSKEGQSSVGRASMTNTSASSSEISFAEIITLALWAFGAEEPLGPDIVLRRGHSAFQCPRWPHKRQSDSAIRKAKGFRPRKGAPFPLPFFPPLGRMGQKPRLRDFSDKRFLASTYELM